MSTTESSIIERISAINAPDQGARNETQTASEVPPPRVDADRAPDDQYTGDSAISEGAIPGDEGIDLPAGDGQAAGDAEELEIGDLNGLAEYLNVDPADLYNIAIPYTKDGQKAEFTLGEIKDKYQAFVETESLRAEAQAQRETYEQANTQAQQLIQAHVMQAEAISRSMEQALLQDFGQVNWQQLQATNPGEYIRLSQQLNARQNQLAQMRHEAGQFIESQTTQLKEQQDHMQRQVLLREQQALLKAIPEWRDQKAADAERQALAHYMIERGYSEAEIDAVTDHRAILLVRDAMRYRQQKANGDIAAKKVIKLAKKIVSPGTRQTASEKTHDQERGLRQSLKRTGSTQDAAALISARLNRR